MLLLDVINYKSSKFLKKKMYKLFILLKWLFAINFILSYSVNHN